MSHVLRNSGNLALDSVREEEEEGEKPELDNEAALWAEAEERERLEAMTLARRQVQEKDYMELVGVAIATVAFVQQLKQSLGICEQIDPKALNWTTIDEITAVAEDPEKHMKQVGKNIIFNGVNINSDMHKAIESYRNGQFEEAGAELGTALTLALADQDNLFLF